MLIDKGDPNYLRYFRWSSKYTRLVPSLRRKDWQIQPFNKGIVPGDGLQMTCHRVRSSQLRVWAFWHCWLHGVPEAIFLIYESQGACWVGTSFEVLNYRKRLGLCSLYMSVYIFICVYIYIFFFFFFVYIYIFFFFGGGDFSDLNIIYLYRNPFKGNPRNLEAFNRIVVGVTRHCGTSHAGVVRATKGSWRLDWRWWV